jgi:hypothetical protein
MLGISLLIATAFSIGFFIESIVGFGGGLIAYFILGFFIDLKTMIMAGLYIGTCSSFYIAITDIKNFDKKIFLKSMPIALIGTIIGVYAFSHLSESLLSIIFGTILLLLSLKIIAFDEKVTEFIATNYKRQYITSPKFAQKLDTFKREIQQFYEKDTSFFLKTYIKYSIASLDDINYVGYKSRYDKYEFYINNNPILYNSELYMNYIELF